MKVYLVSANNLYPIVATLICLRIPFEFRPHKAYLCNNRKSYYGKSILEITIEEEFFSFEKVVSIIEKRHGSDFGIKVIQIFDYESKKEGDNGSH